MKDITMESVEKVAGITVFKFITDNGNIPMTILQDPIVNTEHME